MNPTATETATLKATFAYNGLGQRLTKTDTGNGTGRHFLYGTDGALLAETDADGNVLLEYLYLNGRLLAVYSPDDDQDGLSNQQEAGQGTLPANTDSDGDGLTNLVEWFQYGTDSANPDSDGDGVLDGAEVTAGTSPLDAGTFPGDGDITADSATNAGDLVLLYQMVLGTRTPTPAQFTRADMNRDGQLNAADILLLQKKLLQAALGIPDFVAIADIDRVRPDPQPSTTPLLANWLNALIPPAAALPANSGVLYYVHNDPLGAPQALTDESGTWVWSASYDPYGQATVNEDVDGDGNPVVLNVRFPGQYYDSESGLHYNGARYYDPGTGRYITSDPIGIDGGLNTYLYANANPIRFFDPDGEAAQAAAGLCLVPGVGWVSCAAVAGGATVVTLACIITGACEDAAQTILGCFSSDADDDGENEECEQLLKVDTDTCNAITRTRGGAAGAACHASASQRYAACLRGQPLPPLNTWNN